MATAADRGKWSEGEVRKHLDKLDAAFSNFTFDRIVDARATRGRSSVAVAGDFQAFLKGRYVSIYFKSPYGELFMPDYTQPGALEVSRNFLIEVKETEASKTRLPYKNFDTGAVGRARMRALAGSEVLVLVCHRPESVWRAVPLDVFVTRDARKPGGSWDLSAFPETTHVKALNALFGLVV